MDPCVEAVEVMEVVRCDGGEGGGGGRWLGVAVKVIARVEGVMSWCCGRR